jgi:hypothetical protein
MTTNPHTSAASLSLLHTLLDASLLLPHENRHELTNHLPMALHALYNLGASSQRMRDFFTHNSLRYSGMAPCLPAAPAVDWHRLRGQLKTYPALFSHFQQWLARDGTEAVLRMALPDLLSGVSAAAFHGVIRTAHAVESGHTGELAAALAYWACRWQHLALPTVTQAPIPLDLWAPILIAKAEGWHGDGALISIRMEQATRSTIYQDLAGTLQPATDLCTQIAILAALAVERYVASRNFTVLHLVTGLRALRVLLPWTADSAALQPVLVHAFVAAYLAARVAPLDAQQAQNTMTWPEVIGIATASSDSHVVKIVHACKEEAMHYGEGLYLRAAALATQSSHG